MDYDIFTNLIEEKDKNTNDELVSIKSGSKKNLADDFKTEALTTKIAIKFLLEGRLKSKVCRYCLNITQGLAELDQVMNVAGTGSLYKVTIRDIVASFHPFKVVEDPNFPNKICQNCLDRALAAYLFTQQCERAERAMLNCFEDIYEKFERLDPIDRPKKRGRQKLNPNYNKLHVEYNKVIDYAEPIINIINIGAESATKEAPLQDFECKKCWQVLPNMESLLNHEKIHPKTMWYHCRLCGKSFPKANLLKKHHDKVHILGKEVQSRKDNNFVCNECNHSTESYILHLQHIEKHKFKKLMKHVIEKRMNKLCTVCLNKSDKMVDLEHMVCLHGGHPELMGDKTLRNILAYTLPNMKHFNNYLGTKICNKCLNNAITSYIFIQQFNLDRERLNTCVTLMLKNIKSVKPNANVFVQISRETIMPNVQEIDETLIFNDNDYIDESKLKVDVLEDEFRIKSDSESDNPTSDDEKSIKSLDNPAKNATKTYTKKKLINGLQSYPMDICSEFLTFNKRVDIPVSSQYTCPLCNKSFISKYFFKRHVLKHINMKVYCKKCNSVFKSKFYLYEHTKMCHILKTNDYFSCKVCGRCFLNADKLKIHKRCHKNIECQVCGKIFATQSNYITHVQRHVKKIKFTMQKELMTCSFCEKECLNENELSLHVNKVHLQIKPFGCDMCEKHFYTAGSLKYHKKVHSMNSKEVCAFCNKTFRCRKNLVIHIRKHIGAKPFLCQICSQGFHSMFKAREHMKVYHGGRFCCILCKTTFVTKYGLKDHIQNEHGII